ncbi:hypothetical protein RB195_019199 [Necator americanus]|uniref:Uncharacterized protein n=1 Tax=Necator americanus TaxID=51031 RepID=A0ABR1CE35_NECAM
MFLTGRDCGLLKDSIVEDIRYLVLSTISCDSGRFKSHNGNEAGSTDQESGWIDTTKLVSYATLRLPSGNY